jgi:hypothetical protein
MSATVMYEECVCCNIVGASEFHNKAEPRGHGGGNLHVTSSYCRVASKETDYRNRALRKV